MLFCLSFLASLMSTYSSPNFLLMYFLFSLFRVPFPFLPYPPSSIFHLISSCSCPASGNQSCLSLIEVMRMSHPKGHSANASQTLLSSTAARFYPAPKKQVEKGRLLCSPFMLKVCGVSDSSLSSLLNNKQPLKKLVLHSFFFSA